MTYRVEWIGAQRDRARLPNRVAMAVLVYVDERLAQNPRRLRKPLAGELPGIWSARNGDYRVLRRINEDSQTIVILHVDHRAHAYRPR